MAAPHGDPHTATNIDPDCAMCKRVYPEEHAAAVRERARTELAAMSARVTLRPFYAQHGLTFDALRRANRARLPLFKNAKGEPAHSKPDGSDWSPLEWAAATNGELGELTNLLKKVKRGDVTLHEVRQKIADELADVQTYLDITAQQCGVDLGEATIKKWNEVSDRVGAPVKLFLAGDGFEHA